MSSPVPHVQDGLLSDLLSAAPIRIGLGAVRVFERAVHCNTRSRLHRRCQSSTTMENSRDAKSRVEKAGCCTARRRQLWQCCRHPRMVATRVMVTLQDSDPSGEDADFGTVPV